MKTENTRILFAHNLRAVAILLVIMSHFAGLFWQNPPIIHALLQMIPVDNHLHPGAMFTVAQALHFHPRVDYGALGVALFFVISGFVIPFSLERYGRGQFAIARLFRIYPTYWMGLLVTLAAIYCGGRYFHYETNLESGRIIKQLLLIRDWFWIPPLDAVSWSLEIEVKFYLICLPAAGWLRNGRVVPLLLIPLGLAGLSLIAADGNNTETIKWTNVVQYDLPIIAFMFTGVVMNLLYRQKLDPALAGCAIAVVLGCSFMAMWKSEVLGAYSGTMILNYSLALTLFCTCYYFRRFAVKNPIVNFLADISYPLYAVHAVSGFLIMEVLLARGWNTGAAAGTALAAAITLAAVIHWTVELPTTWLGKWLAVKLKK